MYLKSLLCSLLLIIPLVPRAQNIQPNIPYPVIETLDSKDPVFNQWQNRLKASFKRGQDSPLLFFAYRVKSGETLAKVASKTHGWQATLATLNGLSHISDLSDGQWILLPTKKGIFLYDPPQGLLQELMVATRDPKQSQEMVVWQGDALQKVHFFSFTLNRVSGDFQNSERYFFLDSEFSFPLQKFRVSSGFGWRQSPLSGMRIYHRGIDLGAPFGTLAYPAKAGIVIQVGKNKMYGKYVVIKHSNGYQSLYGHFQKILVGEGEHVAKNKPIGEVGDTGMSRGSHLHFEIYKQGEIQNPSVVLRGR